MIKITPIFAIFINSLWLISCGTAPCHDIVGRWVNGEGQTLIFENEKNALWLVHFGSQVDSFPVEYRYACGGKQVTLDLSGFQRGALVGKTLYGLLDWNDENAFRFAAEPGTTPEARPETFSDDAVQTFKRD